MKVEGWKVLRFEGCAIGIPLGKCLKVMAYEFGLRSLAIDYLNIDHCQSTHKIFHNDYFTKVWKKRFLCPAYTLGFG